VFLALKEMRRAKVRFGLLISAIALLVLLILAQQAIQNGLITSFIGAIERQSAPVLVYSVDGQKTLQGSLIPPDLQKAVEGVDGVSSSGKIGQGTFTVRVSGSREDSDAAIIGYERADLGAPQPLSAGRLPNSLDEAVGSAADFSVGDRVRVLPPGGVEGGPGGPEVIEVVGLAEKAQLQVTPTLFTKWETYVAAVRTANPDAGAVLPSVIGLAPVEGVTPEELASRANRANPQADALTRAEAAELTPGVAEVRSSFQVIFLLFGMVVPLVTGLFFLIVTLQKSSSLVLLRAVGAPAGRLVRSLMFQVVVVVGLGLVIGVALYTPLSQARAGSVDLSFDPQAVLVWSALLLSLGVLSALVAARRVLAIDPIEATKGDGGI
jgi:putative ABC transport system permease protein